MSRPAFEDHQQRHNCLWHNVLFGLNCPVWSDCPFLTAGDAGACLDKGRCESSCLSAGIAAVEVFSVKETQA